VQRRVLAQRERGRAHHEVGVGRAQALARPESPKLLAEAAALGRVDLLAEGELRHLLQALVESPRDQAAPPGQRLAPRRGATRRTDRLGEAALGPRRKAANLRAASGRG